MDLQAYVLEQGADGAGWIPPAKLPIDAVLRKACEANTCGSFGKTYGCPPYVGTPEEVTARARSFAGFLLFQTIGQLEDSFDAENMSIAGAKHAALTRTVHDALYRDIPGLLTIGAGGCKLCEECGVQTGTPCPQPERVIPSVSGFCINVSRAAAMAGLKYNNGPATVTFFSGLFVPEGFIEHKKECIRKEG